MAESLGASPDTTTLQCPRARPRLVHVTTVPLSLWFLRGQAGFMRHNGFDVHAVSSPGPELRRFGRTEQVQVHAVPMSRRISPSADVVALRRLARLFADLRPAIVHAHTPKAGLLAMIAARLTRVPVRIYHVHGMPMSTAAGLRRLVMWGADVLAARLADRVLWVSGSGLAEAERLGTIRPGAGRVLRHGSINGVDTAERFDPSARRAEGAAIRSELGVPPEDVVIGFVGRVVRDKGIVELARAWTTLRQEFPHVRLLLVGAEEDGDPVPGAVITALRDDPRVHFAGHSTTPESYYSAMQIVALPSHREGFGLAALEGSAMGLPVVATRVPGLTDAVVDGVTGTLVPAGDSGELAAALRVYVVDPGLRGEHGAAGRARARRDFVPQDMWNALEAEYRALLAGLHPDQSSTMNRGGAT
ncbi:glycosyltransferase family 4 protein [Pseudonocardia lacus]|uniref:glycosyltransferase family 4 protein n=1 Tax=Pseudonocardia lacus TaxID=2835865 RepID=UPI001BDCB7A1|nr:glycosyltransferase family 4 protein [Pseudonocardia lacus]